MIDILAVSVAAFCCTIVFGPSHRSMGTLSTLMVQFKHSNSLTQFLFVCFPYTCTCFCAHLLGQAASAAEAPSVAPAGNDGDGAGAGVGLTAKDPRMDVSTSAAPALVPQSLPGSVATSSMGPCAPTHVFAAFESTGGPHPSILAHSSESGSNGAPAFSFSTTLADDLLPSASGGEAVNVAQNGGDGVEELDGFWFSDDGWGELDKTNVRGSGLRSKSGLTIEVPSPQFAVDERGEGVLSEGATTDLMKVESSTISSGFSAFVHEHDGRGSAGASTKGSGASGCSGDAAQMAADTASTVGVAGRMRAEDEPENLFAGLSVGGGLSEASAVADTNAPSPVTNFQRLSFADLCHKADQLVMTPVSVFFVVVYSISLCLIYDEDASITSAFLVARQQACCFTGTEPCQRNNMSIPTYACALSKQVKTGMAPAQKLAHGVSKNIGMGPFGGAKSKVCITP